MTVCPPPPPPSIGTTTALPWPAKAITIPATTSTTTEAWVGMDTLQKEFRRQIEGVWSSIGLSEEERGKRLSALGEYFKEVFTNVISKEKECRDALDRSVKDMRQQITNLSAELEERVSLDDSVLAPGLPLRRQEAALLPIYNGLKKLHEERLASLRHQYEDLVAARHQLGILPLPPTPKSVSRSQLEQLEDLRRETMEVAEERLCWIHDAVGELQQLIEEAFGGEWPLIVEREGEEKLRCDPEVPQALADSHASLSTLLVGIESSGPSELRNLSDVATCVLLKDDLKIYVEELLKYCNEAADARTEEAAMVYQKIRRLLRELEMTDADVGLPGEEDDITLDTEGIQALHSVLQSLIDTRHDRLLELIEGKRTLIRDAVQEMRMSRLEAKALRLDALLGLEIGALSDEEVELHGRMCELLTERLNAVRPIMRLLGRMEQLFGVKLELQESLKDPERLMARPSLSSTGRRSSTSSSTGGRRASTQRTRDPGRLLREEKMRNMVAKELPTVQQKLRDRLEDFERTFEIPLLMRGSTPEDRGGGDGGLDYAVSVAVELAISRGEFPTTQEANRESRELLDEARLQMASMYDGLASPGLLEVSESPSPAQRSSCSSSSPEQVHENPGDVGVAEKPSAAASFLRLDTTPVSSKSPESQGQWGEILSPSKVITPLYAPLVAGAATPGPGISLLEASSLGDFGSPPTDKMTTRSLPQRSHTVSDLREDSGSSDDVSFHSPMAFARSPVVVQHGPVRLSLREQRERLKAAKTTRGLDELRASLEGPLAEALRGS
ncbi:hypothetical protein FOZ61_000611 [Perkinsus olseni]|uniref:Uncharacterized protein n=1 Tax=Perkinsus olseni TaxID=32597 RepID=A0A7J6LZH6_PEROL|nr:hypothetical protein FOZ61_000611 [Perkinsus olseni]